MTKHFVLVLALAGLTCSDKGAALPDGDGGGNTGTGGSRTGGTGTSTGGAGGQAAPDAGTCACTKEVPDAGEFQSALTSSWDCYCAAQPNVCAQRIESYVAIAKAKYCYQIRQYASCSLTSVFYRAAGVDPGGSSVFDQTTGQVVGVQFGSDTMIQCPTDPSSPFAVLSRSYKSGRLPGADCPETSCTGTCAGPFGMGVPTQTEQPCTP